jgi:hypothetical protein
MILQASLDRARLGRRVRTGVLAIVALLIAHDAIFLAEYGTGPSFARAMTEGGHDGYWLPFTVGATIAGGLLLLRSLTAVRRLEAEAGRVGWLEDQPAPSYWSEELAIWRVLFPVVTLLFAIQENLEHLALHGHLLGLEALAGPENPLALPVIAVITGALAALGALLRWRIAVLRRRIAAVTAARPRATDDRLCPEWGSVHAFAPHRWITGRLDAGRAPPRLFPA